MFWGKFTEYIDRDYSSGVYKRNRSLTNDEIEAFWRSKQKTVEEHLKEITSLSDAKNHEVIYILIT